MGKRQIFEYKSTMDAPSDVVYRWHCQPNVFDRLTPPWESVNIAMGSTVPKVGSKVLLMVGTPLFKLPWLAKHVDVEPGVQFSDIQVFGPFAYWHHTHKMEPISAEQSALTDLIEYELPLAPLSEWIIGKHVRNKLERLFAYRHEITKADTRDFRQQSV